MRRREFIKLLGGVAATWPLSAGPGYGDRPRRIGVLSSLAETDLEGKSWDATFRKRLDELGWVDGRKSTLTTAGALAALNASNCSRRS
jgi:putative ABC transport system substrate-binding protein